MACKKGQFDVVKKIFGINLKARHVNGVTSYLAVHSGFLKVHIRLVDTLE